MRAIFTFSFLLFVFIAAFAVMHAICYQDGLTLLQIACVAAIVSLCSYGASVAHERMTA